MIFAVDIGNTSIAAGCIDNGNILFTERISSNMCKTQTEYAIDFKLILEFNKINASNISGAIISSVVPPLSDIISNALEKILDCKPLIVGPGVKNGLSIKIDNPAQLGSDLVVCAVAAAAEYSVPSIIIDMGTATTFSVINSRKEYIGGAIIPGAQVALDSLSSRTTLLPHISLSSPKNVIGKNTSDCMKIGSIIGNAAMIDGMIERINDELGEKAAVIATGGISEYILPYCKSHIVLDNDLMLKGLYQIYQKNRRSHVKTEKYNN